MQPVPPEVWANFERRLSECQARGGPGLACQPDGRASGSWLPHHASSLLRVVCGCDERSGLSVQVNIDVIVTLPAAEHDKRGLLNSAPQ